MVTNIGNYMYSLSLSHSLSLSPLSLSLSLSVTLSHTHIQYRFGPSLPSKLCIVMYQYYSHMYVFEE